MDGSNPNNFEIQSLITKLFTEGLTELTYMDIIAVLDNCMDEEVDALIFAIDYLNLSTVALDLVINEYKLKKLRKTLGLTLKDFPNFRQPNPDDKSNEVEMGGPIGNQVLKNI